MNKPCPWCNEEPAKKGATYVQCATQDCPGSRILFTAEEWNERVSDKKKDSVPEPAELAELVELTGTEFDNYLLNDKTDFWSIPGGTLDRMRGHNGTTVREFKMLGYRVYRSHKAVVPLLLDEIAKLRNQLAKTKKVLETV